ncbi:MAG: hypothetical protein NC114_08985 [Ruminococcus flavefaciens]|nr:hypothetical protein [Ruminococcus flavefaciens]
MKTFAKIIGYGLVVLMLAAAVGFAYKYTNGFNEDLKTFYVEYNGRQILTTENKLTLKKEAVHRFDVKYTFDKDDDEPKGYKVKIVSNMTRDFDYTVDGEKYLFSKTGDLTAAFEPIMHDASFELYFPESLSFSEILKKAHNGTSVSVPNDALTNNPYPFRLQISSYNDNITYNFDFTFGESSSGITDSDEKPDTPTQPSDPITPITPDVPSELEKQHYAISWRVEGNENNLLMADVICPETAAADETVEFSVSLIGDYKSQVTKIDIYSDGKLYKNIAVSYENNSGNYYATFSFTMPEGSVEIVVTIKAIVVSEYRNISYDTLGSGSYDSVMVYCADIAKPGEYVMGSIYIAYGLENELQITHVVLENADTGDEILSVENPEYFDFTMPDCDVVILIYLMPV